MIMGYQLDVFQFGIGEFVVMACEQIESYIFGATTKLTRDLNVISKSIISRKKRIMIMEAFQLSNWLGSSFYQCQGPGW